MNGFWTFVVYWMLFFSIPVAYLTPAIIALGRENRNRTQVVIVDVLTGWTVAGWIVALVMAFQAKPVPALPPYQYAVR